MNVTQYSAYPDLKVQSLPFKESPAKLKQVEPRVFKNQSNLLKEMKQLDEELKRLNEEYEVIQTENGEIQAEILHLKDINKQYVRQINEQDSTASEENDGNLSEIHSMYQDLFLNDMKKELTTA